MDNLKSIKIMSWNPTTLNKKYYDVTQSILDYRLDIVGICETRLDPTISFKVAGFNVYRNDRNSEGGGVALLISKKLVQTQVALPNLTSIEAIAVKIKTNHGHITFISVYLPPKNKFKENDFINIFNISNNIILFGDLNAKHPAWDYNNNENTVGKNYLNFATERTYVYILQMNQHTSPRKNPSLQVP